MKGVVLGSVTLIAIGVSIPAHAADRRTKLAIPRLPLTAVPREITRIPGCQSDVCFGSLADIAASPINVCFTPESGHQLTAFTGGEYPYS